MIVARPARERSHAVLLVGLRQHGLGLFGGVIIVVLLGIAALATWIAPHDPAQMHPGGQFRPPDYAFLFGTDNFGRDVLSRVIFGARISLHVAMTSVSVAVTLGVVVGLLSGFYGGIFDLLTMRVMDILFSFPSLLLALALMGFLGPTLTNLIIAISIVYIPTFARITRGEVLVTRSSAFVEAAGALGASDGRIIVRHLLPNVLPILIIQATTNMGFAIIAESSLSYLGLGSQPPTPSWGRMLSEGRGFLAIAPWTAIFPGTALMLTVLGFLLLGDALRDVLDPRLRRGPAGQRSR
ncbi:MAG: ABC transporter permease [Armatimonadetes bacterium]|nr:ABC transporter permease [Armatimonadota bacterium]